MYRFLDSVFDLPDMFRFEIYQLNEKVEWNAIYEDFTEGELVIAGLREFEDQDAAESYYRLLKSQ